MVLGGLAVLGRETLDCAVIVDMSFLEVTWLCVPAFVLRIKEEALVSPSSSFFLTILGD